MATPSLGFDNFYTSTLSAGITASDTTIYLNALPTATEGYLVIEPDSSTQREIIYYTSKGANFVTCPSAAAGRGVGATTAQSHSSGVTAQMNVVAEHFEALQDGTAFTAGGIGATAYADGWTPILGSTPNSVTYNGNRNYDLVFNSVDLTGYLSPGMKLRATRTVAAPYQCTDLESSSSQYYSKTSPAGMTFTDDFVVSAWVKLESYPSVNSIVASRYNGTSGWRFGFTASGQIFLQGFNGGASNTRYVYSYTSIPLNKWVHITAQLDMSSYTATTTTCYVMIDGIDVLAALSQSGTNPTALIQAGDLQIGADNTTNYFDGKIAQVAIYSAKIPQATIKASCNQTLSGSETSLVSAYSFNGVITDLNTTNANNLTANGSAVATNADSPYANAVTAGLLEYAEINSVTFSTNTTVNVRVPDTSILPTSGGISAVAYSSQNNPYGLPAFSNLLGQSLLMTSSTVTATTYANLPGMVCPVYIPVGKKVKINFYIYQTANTASALHSMEIYNGTPSATTQIQATEAKNRAAPDSTGFMFTTVIYTPSTYGNITFYGGFRVNTGTATIYGYTVSPNTMTVELV